MNYSFVLALDPSGSYHEGKGTTGWSVYNCLDKNIIHGGSIPAASFNFMEAYWDEHIRIIASFDTKYHKKFVVVIEDYLLYANKAESQINSHMETCKLIGVIQHYCWTHQIPYVMQCASEVKLRWSNEILLYKKIVSRKEKKYYIPVNKKPIDRHCLDSIRHGIHYATFKNETKR